MYVLYFHGMPTEAFGINTNESSIRLPIYNAKMFLSSVSTSPLLNIRVVTFDNQVLKTFTLLTTERHQIDVMPK